jgi:formylglycine-generating enzyme required for sulfatase activity
MASSSRNRTILVAATLGVVAVVVAVLILRSGEEPPPRVAPPAEPGPTEVVPPAPGQVPILPHRGAPAAQPTPDAPGAMRFVRGGRAQVGVDEAGQADLIEWCKRAHGADCTPAAFARDMPLRETILKPFFVDRTETTNRDFAAFLERKNATLQGDRVLVDGKLAARLLPGGGLETAAGHARARADADEKPVVGVTWSGAQTFCQDAGKRLPTESEWEVAARGPFRARFPWGNTDPDCDRAVFARGKGQSCEKSGPGPLRVAAVEGDVSYWGIADLAGNVSEWTLEIYPGKELKHSAVPWRIVRGGAFDRTVDALRATRREPVHDDETRIDLGFRCAKPAT